SEGLNYEEIQFDNLNLKGNGDKNSINLEILSFQYQKNNFQANGKYGLIDKSYNFKFNSQDIQLDFLNAFLEKYNKSSLKGRAYFDLKLSNKGNIGVVAGEGIGFKFPKQGITGEKIDFEFELLEKKLEIVNFQGLINEGKTELLGFLNLPTLREIESNPYYYEDLNYDLTLKTEKLKYEVPNYMDFLININLNLNSNKIKGEVEVEKGNLIKIPGVGEGLNLFKIIKEFVFNKTLGKKNESKELWNDELETTYESKIDLDIDMRIKDGIKIDVDSIGGIVQNLNGNFKGRGKLSGKGKKINFLGEFNLNNGEFILTGNDFQINSARIIFNNPKDIFPQINPVINFEAGSRSFTDNISLSLNG
ncbi:MAG: translocation/assembly module TamB domain-containing protein, partial [Fusobacteriaceae bacterium]